MGVSTFVTRVAQCNKSVGTQENAKLGSKTGAE